MNNLGNGFYAVIVCLIVVTLSFNILYMKYKVEKDNKIQWKLLNNQLMESKEVLDSKTYHYLQKILIKIKIYIRDYYPFVYKLFWSDFVVLILVRIFMIIISFPLFFVFMVFGITEGLISRNKKSISFKIYSVFKYKWSKRIFIISIFIPVCFYISFPYYFYNMFYISSLIVYSIMALLTFNMISNLPKGL